MSWENPTMSKPGQLRKIFAGAGLTLALLASLQAAAQWDGEYEPHEVARLPAYCYARMMRNSPADWKYWTGVMGPMYEHIHHYCRGMILTNRAHMPTIAPQFRKSNLFWSASEFDYVIKQAPPTFVLLPEILTKKGENLIEYGQIARGVVALEQAMSIKPDYWPPYAAMSDYYKRLGDTKKAREWLDKALAVAPEAKSLKSRLAGLGEGKKRNEIASPAEDKPAKPRPAPAAPAEKPEAESQASAAQPATEQ